MLSINWKKIKYALFDFDWIIVESESIAVKVTDIVLKRMNISLSNKELSTQIWIVDSEFYEWIINKYNLEQSVDQLLSIHDSIYNKKLINKNPMEWVFEILSYLNQLGLNMAIVSWSKKQQITSYLEEYNLSKYFPNIISCEDYLKWKPSIEPYQIALKKINLLPEDCIWIEDSSKWIESLNKNSITSIWINTYNSQNLEFASFQFNNINNFLEFLKKK